MMQTDLYNPNPLKDRSPGALYTASLDAQGKQPLAFQSTNRNFDLGQLYQSYLHPSQNNMPELWNSPYASPWMTANNPFGEPIQYAPTIEVRDELLRQLLGMQGLNADPNVQTGGSRPPATGRMAGISNAFASQPRTASFGGSDAQRSAHQNQLGMLDGPAMRSLALQEPQRLLQLLGALTNVYGLNSNIYATQQTDDAAARIQSNRAQQAKASALGSIPIAGPLIGGLSLF